MRQEFSVFSFQFSAGDSTSVFALVMDTGFVTARGVASLRIV
jgi:hypothetical protein